MVNISFDSSSNPPGDFPPAYSPSTSVAHADDPQLPAYNDLHLQPPTRPGESGYASDSVLVRGLQVPSRSVYFTSGFTYPSLLASYHVTEHHWDQFTREIMKEAKLSPRQWSTVVGKGLSVLTVGGLMFGFFSTIPAYLTGRAARRNREHGNLVYSCSELSRKIDFWNDFFFRPRGILIRVDLPAEGLEDIQGMDISNSRSFRDRERQWQQQQEDRDNADLVTSRSSGVSGQVKAIRATFNALDDRTAKENALFRARIVIIPLQGMQQRQLDTGSTTTTDQESSSREHSDDTCVVHGMPEGLEMTSRETTSR